MMAAITTKLSSEAEAGESTYQHAPILPICSPIADITRSARSDGALNPRLNGQTELNDRIFADNLTGGVSNGECRVTKWVHIVKQLLVVRPDGRDMPLFGRKKKLMAARQANDPKTLSTESSADSKAESTDGEGQGNLGKSQETDNEPSANQKPQAEAVPLPLLTEPADQEDAAAIREFFDAEFYLQSYADVAESGLDPLHHFIVYGWRERRDPSSGFSTAYYLSQNKDIREGNINPFAHYCSHGRFEGRLPKPSPTTANSPNSGETEAEPGIFDGVSDEINTIKDLFDSEYYQDQYPDIKEGGIDPLLHFVRFGWREGRNPNRHFSTEYYLKTNPDIAASGINPFVHFCRWGKAEKREAMPYYVVGKEDFQPLVSVIVPNYNHAQYLPERFRSILSQTYTNIELIVLDDKSKDNSIEVINEELKDASIPVQTCFNETNSGNVFAQWQRGVEMANGDLVWICESDDTCEPDFLEKAVPHFVDRAVMLTFGGIQFCNSAGEHMPGMDGFRENSESGIWSEVVKRPAKQWFDGAFGINNVVANVGGCVFRRMPISAGVWQEATTYKIAGDWFLYSHIIGGGKMVYEPDARTYFRQHEKNTSASNFDKLYYYEELWRLLKHHIRQWGISASAREKFIENMAAQYRHFEMEPKHGPFEEVFDTESIMTQTRERKHIVLAFLGFHSGGGEVFPINMANKLLERGHFVSMLAYNMADINQSMIERLDRRVPVLHFGDIRLHGRDQFFASIGASVVHSHVVHCDVGLLRDTPPPSPVPYVVSLHGSHDTLGSDENSMLFGFLQGVNHWVYTADKNLKMFKGIPLDPAAVSKVRNAMPRDTEPFPQTREDLGIDPDAVVYTLVARGIQQKGWRAAIAAFRQMQEERPDIHAHLILIGDGDKADEATAGIKDHENISNLGFQSQINGIYQLTDCAVVPTRFDGESFPLCIIQALQEGTPVIATDIGEIKNMINDGAVQAGILLENKRNSEEFFGDLFQAMVEMADQEKRAAWAENASALGKLFDMDDMVDTYERIYDAAGERHRSLHPEFYDEEAA